MNIGVIGVGGVGGYFGGKLTRLLKTRSDLKIFFIARNEHLKKIEEHGLILKTTEGGESICRPTLVTDNFDDLPQLDLCLICVKSYDLDSVLRSLKPRVKHGTHVIPLLNGADIYDRVRSVISDPAVYPACAYLGTHIKASGTVAQNGGNCTIFFGKDPKNDGVIPDKIFDLFDEARIKYEWLDDPFPEIWSKYIFIAAYGLVSASEDKSLGEILENEALSNCTMGIMNEIAQIATKKGVRLSKAIVRDSYEKARTFPFETKTSFQRDFKIAGSPDERSLYGETIIRLGAELGIETPNTKLANEKLTVKKPLSKKPLTRTEY